MIIQINEGELPQKERYTKDEIDSIYNVMDSMLTIEIFQKLQEQLKTEPKAQLTYDFTRGMRAPALEMMMRGLNVCSKSRVALTLELEGKLKTYQETLDAIGEAMWGKGLNYNSPLQLQRFLYELMGIPKAYKNDKGTQRVSVDVEALESLNYIIRIRPIIKLVLKCRDLAKKLQVLRKKLSPDGRIRTTYNVVGTETTRWSSSANCYDEGDNIQNWTEFVRSIVESSPGRKIAYIDLEQAESRAVAYLSGDEKYIQACESGDIHTDVCRNVWPDLDWTGTSNDKKVAEQPHYRHFTFRDISKRVGHGTNYYGKPFTLAKRLHIEKSVIEEFQNKYFSRFPKIREWHNTIAQLIQTQGYIEGPMITFRRFLGRSKDDATLREAIAHGPQSMVGNILNLGLYALWEADLPSVHLWAQIHDAILISYDERLEDEIIPQACHLIEQDINVNGRILRIPTEAQVGWNWGKFSKENPNGLKKWKEGQPDTRKRV